MKNLILLKLGGSVITDKYSETPKVDFENLNRLAGEVAEAYKTKKMKLILLHGAGSYGHQIVKKTRIADGIKSEEQKVAFAETQRLQNELNVIVTKSLIEKGLPSIPCQPSSMALMESGRLKKMDCSAIKGFLKIGLIPVLYGVPAYDKKQKCSILSGDQIAPFVALKLGANKIIHGTDVDGVFTADPKKDKNAELIKEINCENVEQVRQRLSGSAAVDVTGGMLGKISELLHIAQLGIESQIVNALKPDYVKNALLGEKCPGTIIVK
jgi:isopentenyl phosphate kinase